MTLGLKNPFTIPRTITETEIVNWILDYLKTVHGVYWRNNTQGTFDPTTQSYRPFNGLKGVSDILGIYEGRFIAIEVKTPQNKKRPSHQVEFIDMININGGLAFFATDVNTVRTKFKENGII